VRRFLHSFEALGCVVGEARGSSSKFFDDEAAAVSVNT